MLRLAAAGFLAASASVIELQVGPVSAILGLYLLVEVIRRRYPFACLLSFAAGAMIPTLVLLVYNQLAFGSPWDMGYFHHVNVRVRPHPRESARPAAAGLDQARPAPLGPIPRPVRLRSDPAPRLRRDGSCCCGDGAGPWRSSRSSSVAAVLLVNLSYPEWTGGWSTGPRLLVPLIPFAMIPVAGLLAERGRWGTSPDARGRRHWP